MSEKPAASAEVPGLSGSRRLEAYLTQHGHLWLVILCGLAFLLTHRAPVDASFSDPWSSLLTAQAIVDHATIRLDHYRLDERYVYAPIEPHENGHRYSYFPLGPSLFALPAVWLARSRGEDMIYREDNRALQNSLSSLTVVISTLLIFALCRRYLSRAASFGLTVVFVFGTSVVSTLGIAYWSSNVAVILGLTLLLLLAASQGAVGWRREALLGVLAFFAYLSRPTLAVLLPLLALLLFRRNRRLPLALVGSFTGLFGLFVAFSWSEYGQPLPPYYLPSRLGNESFWRAFYGHLLSPSRGILVSSPFFAAALAGLAVWARRLFKERLVRFCVAWLVLHLWIISSFHHWWGGWSFGNRLFADALPPAFLVTVVVARVAGQRLSARARRGAIRIFALAALWAVFVHTHQGLFNPYTMLWNTGIDSNEERLFDWRNPQFLASPAALGLHDREHELRAMQPYALDEPLLPASERAIFEGWSLPEGGGEWRWSSSRSPSILWRVADSVPREGELVLRIVTGTYEPQEIGVSLGGASLGVLSSQRHWEPKAYVLRFPAEQLEETRRPLSGDRILHLDFDIPDAVVVGEGVEQRLLGMCLRRIILRAGSR